MSTAKPAPSKTVPPAAPTEANTVALIGVVLIGVTIGMCGLLFWLVSQLPDGQSEFRILENDTPAQMRLLVLGGSTAVLTVVSLILCLIGLVLPNRPRLLAAVGALVSGIMLLGIFGVLIVGAVLNPAEFAAEKPEPTTTTAPNETVE